MIIFIKYSFFLLGQFIPRKIIVIELKARLVSPNKLETTITLVGSKATGIENTIKPNVWNINQLKSKITYIEVQTSAIKATLNENIKKIKSLIFKVKNSSHFIQ